MIPTAGTTPSDVPGIITAPAVIPPHRQQTSMNPTSPALQACLYLLMMLYVCVSQIKSHNQLTM
jgi:hypothetical protein